MEFEVIYHKSRCNNEPLDNVIVSSLEELLAVCKWFEREYSTEVEVSITEKIIYIGAQGWED